jgi:hypothetical protein
MRRYSGSTHLVLHLHAEQYCMLHILESNLEGIALCKQHGRAGEDRQAGR